MPQPTVLITGAEGQLGRMLTATYAARANVASLSRRDLDLRDPQQTADVVARLRPSLILNCAAYNDVDGAEDDAIVAFEVNALAVRALSRAAAMCRATLVHYGSDFVFDGQSTRPYTEDDLPAPRSTYAASKLVGEWFARDAGRWLVLRVESLFGVQHLPGIRRTGSIDRIIDAIEQGQPVKAFRDRVVSPSYLIDVAAATSALIDRAAPSGLYHVVNSGYGTWYELALEVARLIGGAEHIVPTLSSELGLKAARQKFAALSNRRLAETAYVMPSWQDALARYLAFRRAAKSPQPSHQLPGTT